MSRNSTEPLLRDDRRGLSEANDDHIHRHITWLAPSGDDSYLHTTRSRIQRFLTSKTGHYCILLLVSLDVACIFADFVIKIFICEQKDAAKGWNEALDALGIVSLVFSCLFMVELLASIWASGLSYFKSWFHCFDAFIIVAGFVIDVCLRGVLEEVGSLIVILRLWRVIKIIEELGESAEEQMDALSKRIGQLETENSDLKQELHSMKSKQDRASGMSSRD